MVRSLAASSALARQPRVSVGHMNMANMDISPELAAELTALALLSDDAIDTSDIPEVIDWSGASRGMFSPDRIRERGYDVRALANWFLDRAQAAKRGLSNLSLNKLVYLAIERALVEQRILLSPARVEAWAHGPVFRELYQSFKKFESGAITERATKFSVATRGMVQASEAFHSDDEAFFERIFQRFGHRSASQLRAISHVEEGPWHIVWHYRGNTNPGMEITPAIIFERAPRMRDADEQR